MGWKDDFQFLKSPEKWMLKDLSFHFSGFNNSEQSRGRTRQIVVNMSFPQILRKILKLNQQ